MVEQQAEFLISNIERLCLNKIPPKKRAEIISDINEKTNLVKKTELDRRQFNEILLICLETRVTESFFQYFINGADKLLIEKLPSLIDRFKKHSMLQYGSFKFALKKLIKSENVEKDLESLIKTPEEIISDFRERPNPIMEIQKIPREDVINIGHLIEPADETIREKGEFNTRVYLTSDYMDVYVATSMREEIDFHNVFDLCEEVFSYPKIKALNLRYFDPTQSYHKNRIAKGLIEGLMLKRARCTIYSVQESDSFGKDSELAATLAQGKPVIAYVPKYDSKDIGYLSGLAMLPITKLLDKAEKYREQVTTRTWENYYGPFLDKIEEYLKNSEKLMRMGKKDGIIPEDQFKKEANISGKGFQELIQFIGEAEEKFYDKRAKILREFHPLGLQIHLERGVANGVLIARSHKECTDLLYAIC